MCFAPQRRPLSTSQLQKVVRTWCFVHFDFGNVPRTTTASTYFDITIPKSGSNKCVFAVFFPSNARWLSPGRLSSRKDNCICKFTELKQWQHQSGRQCAYKRELNRKTASLVGLFLCILALFCFCVFFSLVLFFGFCFVTEL